MADARIHERGYRPYDGPRLGRAYAVRRLAVHTFARIVGLRRPARAKVLPAICIVLAYLPSAVFVGLASFLPRSLGRVGPAVAEYYGFITLVILLFVAFSAPEALAADRRSRTLSLYLAAPLTRTTYLAAQAGAVAVALCCVTVGPPLLLVGGYTLVGVGPDGPAGVAIVVTRVVVAGLGMAACYTGISIGISSLTDRRAVAGASTALLIVASDGMASALVGAGSLGPWASLLGVGSAILQMVQRIHGQAGPYPELPTAIVVLGALAWAAAGSGLAWWRYQRLRVTR